jgi:membrane complex biogenesis BtpA family protein
MPTPEPSSAPHIPSLLSLPAPWLIGVLHLPALPGAPESALPVDVLAAQAVEDAAHLAAAGFTAVLVENFHDRPFRRERADPETVAAMAVVVSRIRAEVELPVGANVLRNDALAALGICVAAGGSFLRVNVLSGAAATDQGLIEGHADELLRRRRALGRPVAILADVDVKHATSLDTRPAAERARELVSRAGADAVLVTGRATGQPVDLEQLSSVAEAIAPAPALAASGATARQLPELLRRCAGVIVGTALKHPATGRIDPARAAAFAEAAHP